MSRVCAALSGGVDSAAAAALLLRQGHAVTGAMMRLQPGAETGDAAQVCAALGIPFTVLEAQDVFAAQVVQPFIQTYCSGGTPNPCIVCNRQMKFGWMLDWALDHGFASVATGHYARIEHSGSRWLLRAGDDPARDQTYFLYALTQHQLAHIRFPVGELPKAEVRALAASLGLPVAQKKDSQDICFIPGGDYAAFLRSQGAPLHPGRFLDLAGRELGRHNGAEAYTLGQRRGLGLACGAPVYVVRKEGADVVVGPESALYTTRVRVSGCNWIALDPPAAPLRAAVSLRYTRRRDTAQIVPTGEGCAELVFDQPQRAVTPGQAAVFYDGPYVLGGGTIE